MKTLIIILIISSFLQTTIIPIDLVLLILICRAYIKSGKDNLYLAFVFGLLTAHLNLQQLGFQSLYYLFAVQTTQVFQKIRLAGNPLLIVPLSFIFLLLNQFVSPLLMGKGVRTAEIIIASLVSLPVFYAVKLWEERFIVRKEIKLKI